MRDVAEGVDRASSASRRAKSDPELTQRSASAAGDDGRAASPREALQEAAVPPRPSPASDGAEAKKKPGRAERRAAKAAMLREASSRST